MRGADDEEPTFGARPPKRAMPKRPSDPLGGDVLREDCADGAASERDVEGHALATCKS